MTDASSLHRLADLAGIETTYVDAHDRPRTVPDDTLRALLAASGYPADSEGDIADAISDIELAPWRTPLEPVTVIGENSDSISTIITVRAAAGNDLLPWAVTTEDGTVIEGIVRPADFPVEDERIVDGEHLQRRRLHFGTTPLPGYHHLSIGEKDATTTLIVTPEKCHLPLAWQRGERTWGFAVQLYGLRSARNWGMGDFGDLETLAVEAAGLGAGAVGLNPLHALFPNWPDRCSPYSPSSRLFLNVLYIDVEAVPDFAECQEARELVSSPGFRAALCEARDAALINYAAVAALKLPVLDLLYASFRRRHMGGGQPSKRARTFLRFREDGGGDLWRMAVFETLRESLGRDRPQREWPRPYRDASSQDVARFAGENEVRVAFHIYLQWLADEQLSGARERADMNVGFYNDLALGCDADGADAWAWSGCIAEGARLGAPPDIFNPMGQDWGLPPFRPMALREAAYRPFIATLRAAMRHAGAVRLDHVMRLKRLFWIPPGGLPADGGYVCYPFEDLLGIVSLESRRNNCAVIGEDLGTVPKGFRKRLARASILSYRLLWFERDTEGRFLPPGDYPPVSLVAATTHDLATISGFWSGHDLDARTNLGLFPSLQDEKKARKERPRARERLLRALRREGLVLAGEVDVDTVIESIHRFLARAPSVLLMVQFEDLLGERDQVNMPGTTTEHPNWRRRIPLALETLMHDPRVLSLAESLRKEGR